MSSLGINVGRTGGSMMAELLIAGRALGGAAKATGSAIGGIFNRGHSNTTNQAAGQAFTGGGSGLIAYEHCAAGGAVILTHALLAVFPAVFEKASIPVGHLIYYLIDFLNLFIYLFFQVFAVIGAKALGANQIVRKSTCAAKI